MTMNKKKKKKIKIKHQLRFHSLRQTIVLQNISETLSLMMMSRLIVFPEEEGRWKRSVVPLIDTKN
jgi:hypothetical protein